MSRAGRVEGSDTELGSTADATRTRRVEGAGGAGSGDGRAPEWRCRGVVGDRGIGATMHLQRECTDGNVERIQYRAAVTPKRRAGREARMTCAQILVSCAARQPQAHLCQILQMRTQVCEATRVAAPRCTTVPAV